MAIEKRLLLILMMLIFAVNISSCIKKNSISIEQEDVNKLNSLGDQFKLYYIGKHENLLNLNVTYVNSLKEVPFDTKHKHTFLVINNRDDSINLAEQEEEIANLKKNIEENRYSFYYHGKSYMSLFGKYGLYSTRRESPPERYFGYVLLVNVYIGVSELGYKEEEEEGKQDGLFFLRKIVHEFEHVIKMNS